MIDMRISRQIGLMFCSFLAGFLLFSPSVRAETVQARSPKALTDRIAELLNEIQKIQTELAAIPRVGVATVDGACVFDRELFFGVSGEDVSCLQRYLFSIGFLKSSLHVTGYFGALTERGVMSWQADNNVLPAAGYFGKISQKKYSEIFPVGKVSAGVNLATELPANGSELSVLPGVQPRDAIAPVNGARIPLLKLVLAAGHDGDVIVKSLQVAAETVETRSALHSLLLLDDAGAVVGEAQGFDGNLNAVFKEPFRIKAGTVQVMTVVGNRAAHNTGAGQLIRLALTAVEAGEATIKGGLPIRGESIKVDTALSIGQVAIERGGLPERVRDFIPGAKNQPFNVFTLKPTDGESVILKSIRYYQSGDLQDGDITNLVMKVGDARFPLQPVPGTRYFTATLDNFVIRSGERVEIAVQGDLAGGANKSFAFNIVDPSDIWAVNLGSGFGVMPARSDLRFSKENPWQRGTVFSVGSGVFRVKESQAVGDRDIAAGVANQILAAFEIEAYGEPVGVDKISFKIQRDESQENLAGSEVTNIIFEGPEGVLAGPVDEKGGRIVFSGSVIFPIGSHRYVLKGQARLLNQETTNLRVSVDLANDWASAKGVVSDKKIFWEENATAFGGAFVIKPALLAVTALKDIPSNQIRYNTRDAMLGVFQLDAKKSGENIRVASLATQLTAPTNGSQSMLRNCRLFEDKNVLSTGEHIVYPKATADDNSFYSFVINTDFVVTKGSARTVALICDVTSGAAGAARFSWSLPAGTQALANATGVVSGLPAKVELLGADGATFTVLP